MKKNLRNILALALGLMTTVSFAQDWNVDSRTRIDMSGDADENAATQRATLGATWGGSDWGIHLSTNVNYTINDADEDALPTLSVYEVYASTNLFGFANMTIGRQALDYGAGTFLSTNDWSANRNCVDGMTFAVDNDFVGLDLGLSKRDNGDGSDMIDALWLNASKSSGDWSANLFYADYSVNDERVGGLGFEANAMGLDFGYSAMGGALDLNVSYNTNSQSLMGGEAVEQDMMDVSGTYSVNDDMSLTAGRASYGENGFNDVVGLGNQANYGTDSWMTHGNLGHLGANQENMYIGGTYNMGAFSLGATMHTVTDTENDDYERKATEVSVGYSLGDNAALSYKLVTDNNGSDTDANYNWITLTVTP